MIIVTATIVATPEGLDEVVRLSKEHVERSRAEPGCLSHAVYRELDDPLRLTFFEEWVDREALAAHFAVPEARNFVRGLGPLCSERLPLTVYEATQTQI